MAHWDPRRLRKLALLILGVLWALRGVGPSMASPLLYRGFVYRLDRRGSFITCYHANTGERAYHKRVEGARAFWASPWAADGKVYCQDDTGTTHILKPGPEYELLGTNHIDDQFWASSAVADGAILLRGVKALYCVADD